MSRRQSGARGGGRAGGQSPRLLLSPQSPLSATFHCRWKRWETVNARTLQLPAAKSKRKPEQNGPEVRRGEEAAESCVPRTELTPPPLVSNTFCVRERSWETVKLSRTGVRQLPAAAPSVLERLV